MKEENIVKRVCKELGLTQKELAERLGVNDGTVRKWASQTEPPEWAVKFLHLLLEKERLKERLDKFQKAFDLIDEARNE